MTDTHQQNLNDTRQEWDAQAATFDDAPDHGLRDPVIRTAWMTLLKDVLPSGKTMLDIGCGTGSLSLVLAELGCTVTGIDLSPKMIALAQEKAKTANQPIQFHVMDAAFPDFPQQFDGIICRHLLWMLPTPSAVLTRWIKLLKPGGRLLLIEGFWHTGAGMHSAQIIEALPDSLTNVTVRSLSDQPGLWGGEVKDERYLVQAVRVVPE